MADCIDLKDEAQDRLVEVADAIPRGVYEHHKGGTYCLFTHSVHESSLKVLIHYYSFKKKKRWTREVEDWNATVHKLDGRQVRRFQFVRKATRQEMEEACDLKDL